jgi:hypothetical protein
MPRGSGPKCVHGGVRGRLGMAFRLHMVRAVGYQQLELRLLTFTFLHLVDTHFWDIHPTGKSTV